MTHCVSQACSDPSSPERQGSRGIMAHRCLPLWGDLRCLHVAKFSHPLGTRTPRHTNGRASFPFPFTGVYYSVNHRCRLGAAVGWRSPPSSTSTMRALHYRQGYACQSSALSKARQLRSGRARGWGTLTPTLCSLLTCPVSPKWESGPPGDAGHDLWTRRPSLAQLRRVATL